MDKGKNKCWQELWLKGLDMNRDFKIFLEAWMMLTHVLPYNVCSKNFGKSSLTYHSALLVAFHLPQGIWNWEEKVKRWNQLMGRMKLLEFKKYIFSLCSLQNLCQLPRTKPGSQRHSGSRILGTKFPKDRGSLWAMSWNLKPSQNSFERERERGEAASEHFVSYICY